jgi:hypothetical protein
MNHYGLEVCLVALHAAKDGLANVLESEEGDYHIDEDEVVGLLYLVRSALSSLEGQLYPPSRCARALAGWSWPDAHTLHALLIGRDVAKDDDDEREGCEP